MLRLIRSRLLQMIPVIIGVTLVSFALVNVLPGNILYSILGTDYTPAAAKSLSIQLGLNHPLITRYFDWLWQLLHGNLGTSLITHESVSHAILQALSPSLELVITAQIMAIVLGVAFAVASVMAPTPWVDRIATSLALAGNSIPAFVTALVFILIFAVHFHWVSSIGWQPPSSAGWLANIGAISLPSLCLAISIYPGYMRVFRREMYDQLENEEYVTLARMKGVTRKGLTFRHVVRNSALGIVTLIGLSTGLLIGGAVIVEEVFGIPGIGTLLFQAINSRDATMVDGCILVIAIAIIAINLIVDILYAVLDPRVLVD
jgi:peptide/nickel transport system permease protein